jgi:hypothetical protein
MFTKSIFDDCYVATLDKVSEFILSTWESEVIAMNYNLAV